MRMSYSPCIFSRAHKSLLRAGALALMLAGLAACEEPPALPAVGADISQTSVSGLSSGGYMAGQFHLAHSSIIIGAGIVAAGPYGCAQSVFGAITPLWSMAVAQNLNRVINGCTGTAMASVGVPDIRRLAARARELAGRGAIDRLKGLRDDRVYLFSGKADRVVAPALVRKASALYAALGVNKSGIQLVERFEAGHGFVTEDEGGACAVTRAPFLNDCDYDQAGEILKHIYGPLKPARATQKEAPAIFTQQAFSDRAAAMDTSGAVYIPAGCAQKKGCRVHIVFHGCKQGREAVDDAFITGSGYIRWADANRLIVLYPQVSRSAENPNGCWDWWGYTGKKYLTRDAPQIKAVRAMLARLAE